MHEPRSARNHLVWVGVLVSLFGLVSYFTVFYRFQVLRDVPWFNIPAVLAGVAISVWAVTKKRSVWAFVGAGFSFLCAAALLGFVFVLSQQLPSIEDVVAVGQPAPSFALANQNGEIVSLADFAGKNLVMVFYRGFW